MICTYDNILTYCASGRITVPMYADADRLLVFGPSLTSFQSVKEAPNRQNTITENQQGDS